MNPKVVIIGHGYLSRLSLVRSVAEIGCNVTVIVMTSQFEGKQPSQKPIDYYSKYASHYYFCIRKDKDALVSLLLDKCTDPHQKAILIPDGDDVVAAIDNNKDRLREHFLFPHIAQEPSSMEYWMEKTHQKQLAKEIGLNVTNATIVEITDGQYTILSGLQYPVFPKPLATLNGGKGGMRRCDNAKELSKALDYIISTRSRNVQVMVEDYKEIEMEYALLGFSDGKEVIIPGVLQFLAVSKAHPGIALQGKVMPVHGFEELVEKFKELVLRIGFVGVFDIDFFKSDGIFYFCELNLRYGGSGYAYTKMGINMPAMLVQYLNGESVDMKQSINNTAVYVNERMCLDDWKSFYISCDEYRKFLQDADIRFIPDKSDPEPEKAYLKEYRKQKVRRIVYQLIKKFKNGYVFQTPYFRNI